MKLKTKIISLCVIPVIALGIIVSIVASLRVKSAMQQEIFTGLQATALAVRDELDNVASGEYWIRDEKDLFKGEFFNVTEHTNITDTVKEETGIEITIFFGDTRYATSVIKDDNTRALYTQAGEKVVQTVVTEGKEYHADNVDVVGHKFYAYYVPLMNQDGSVTDYGK